MTPCAIIISHCNKAMDHISLCRSNMSGTDKKKLLVIGKSYWQCFNILKD